MQQKKLSKQAGPELGRGGRQPFSALWGLSRPLRVLLQVFMVKASGEVFVNQITHPAAVSAGKGACLAHFWQFASRTH